MDTGLSRREVLQVAAGAALSGVMNLSPWVAWAKAGVQWPGAADAKEIAREAYIYAFPIVQNYLSIYQLALDAKGSQYKGPPNEVHSVARVFTPADTAIITPNSDTPYSYLIMDLRAEPLVVTMPPIERNRYYSLQLVDLYTNNADYAGTRKDGNQGGNFLIARPGWQGQKPAGIRRVIPIATELMFAQFRTQLFNPDDIDKVKEIQGGYAVQPLSEYLRRKAPEQPPEIRYPVINREMFGTRFWKYVNFLLQLCPVLRWETELRAKFERIGVKAGAPWPPPGMPADVQRAVETEGTEAQKQLEEDAQKLTTSVGLFGTPEEMAGRYRERALGAMAGIYGNSAEEAVYPSYLRDAFGEPLDGSGFDYTLTFDKGRLPPVKAFWSLTMYDGKTRFLVDNDLERYLINSAMLPVLKKNADGGITLYLQHDSPGEDLEPNWLPAPNGPMGVVLRLYLPKDEALNGEWMAPAVQKAGNRGQQLAKKPTHKPTRKRAHRNSGQ